MWMCIVSSNVQRAVVVLLGTLILGTLGSAQQFQPYRNAFVQDCVGRIIVRNSSSTTIDCEGGGNFQQDNSGGTVSLGGVIGTPAFGAQLVANLLAESTYGSMRSRASTAIEISGPPAYAFGAASASFQDILTISSPPFNGSEGLMLIYYTLNGTIANQGPTNSTAIVLVDLSDAGPPPTQAQLSQSSEAFFTSTASGLFKVPITFRFIYGRPFALYFSLYTDSGTVNTASGVYLTSPLQGNSVNDFSNTLVLSGITVLDSNGNPLPSPSTFSSVSGTQYSQDGVLKSFEKLSACTQLETEDKAFAIHGSFFLGPGSNGIAPLSEDVTLQVGTFSATTPPGSFNLDKQGQYRFTGIVNGAELEISIWPRQNGGFEYRAIGRHADLSGTSEPATVRLIVGDDGGMTTSNAGCGDE